MNLFEWKKEKTETFREQLKHQIREGFGVDSHFLFSQEEIEDIKEEVFIEDFEEIIEDFDELSLDPDDLLESSELQESFEFRPSESGMIMDIEAEFSNEYTLTLESLNKIKDLFFAEDYEIIEEGQMKAKIVFRRSKGGIIKKKLCGKGMRLVGNRCLPQTGTQKSQERRKGIKLKRAKKAMGAGKKKKAAIKATITNRRVKGRARTLGNTIN